MTKNFKVYVSSIHLNKYYIYHNIKLCTRNILNLFIKKSSWIFTKIVYQLWNSQAIVTVFFFYYYSILELVNFQCWVWVWLLINNPGCNIVLKTLLLIYLFLFYVYEHFAYMHTYLSLLQTPEEGSDALKLELWMVVDSKWATLWSCDPMIF